MNLKDQRIVFGVFITFIIFIFIALGILDKHRIRIDKLERKKMKVDIYMKLVKEAKKFGIRNAKLFVIRRNENG